MDFGPKLSPQNQLDIYFLTFWEHWLGIAKPKNKCLQINPLNSYEILKISYLTHFSTDCDFACLLTNYSLMPSNRKHNSRTRFDFFTNQCSFVPRCAFSPTAAATVLASGCYLCTPLISYILFFTTAYCVI